jgi:excisionase family DNA binding protein
MQMADAAVSAAENPSGGNLGELGIGMMGIGAMQQQMAQQQMLQQQAMQQQTMQQQAPPSAAPAAAAAASGGSEMPSVMTPAQAAEVVQVAEADIVAAIEAGDLKARKIGASYRISKANLEEFLGG